MKPPSGSADLPGPDEPPPESAGVAPDSSETDAASRESSLGRSIGLMGGVNVLAMGAGIVRQKVFAVFLGTTGLGALSLAMSFFQLLTMGSRLGFATGMLREMRREVAAGRWPAAARVFLDVRRILLLVGVGVAAVVALLSGVVSEHLFHGQLPPWTVVVLAAALPAVLLAELSGAGLNALDDLPKLSRSKMYTILSSLAATVALVAAFGLAGGVIQIAAGAVIAFVVSTLVLRTAFRPSDHDAEDVAGDRARAMLTAVAGVGLGQGVFKAVQVGNEFLFRSVVVAQAGTAANGLYQGTMGLSRQYVGALMSGVFVFLYPRLSELFDDRPAFRKELLRVVGILLSLAVPIAAVLLGFRDWIVRLVFTEDFLGMVPLMAWSVPGDVVAVLVGCLRFGLLAAGRAWAFAAVGVGMEIVYFGLFYVGLAELGLEGAVAAYPAYGLLSLLVLVALMGRARLASLSMRVLAQGGAGAALLVGLAWGPTGPWEWRALSVAVALGWLIWWREPLLRELESLTPG